MEHKRDIIEILADVDRYKMDLCAEIEEEKTLCMAAKGKIAILETRIEKGK